MIKFLKNYLKVRTSVKQIAATIRSGQPVIANMEVKAPMEIFSATGVTVYNISFDPKNKVEIKIQGQKQSNEKVSDE